MLSLMQIDSAPALCHSGQASGSLQSEVFKISTEWCLLYFGSTSSFTIVHMPHLRHSLLTGSSCADIVSVPGVSWQDWNASHNCWTASWCHPLWPSSTDCWSVVTPRWSKRTPGGMSSAICPLWQASRSQTSSPEKILSTHISIQCL